MTYGELEKAANDRMLTILGGLHPEPHDGVPEDCQTLLMLGPKEPEFWPIFKQSPEYMDSHPNPMDRWSRRVIGTWAKDIGATPLYPFGGPPYQPFIAWAQRTGRVHASPVHLLVHDTAGLFVSFRGALALPLRIDLPPAPANPCDTCPDQPCRTACPSTALTPERYDVPACKAYLATHAGQENMALGCNVRRSCPVSQNFGRLPQQSAFHMTAFKGS